METLNSAALAALIFLKSALPFFAAAGLIWLIRKIYRSAPGPRQTAFYALLSLVGFTMLDGLLLFALPLLRLSFGPVVQTLVLFFNLRAILFIVWMKARAWSLKKTSRATPLWLFLLVNALFAGASIDALYFEPFNLQVTTVELPVNAARISRPVRIVQLSDTHIERTTRREQEVLAQVKRLQPDLIVLTGDYLNYSYLDDPLTLQDAQAFFAQLSAPYGVFAISGSEEDDSPRMAALFSTSQATILDDQVARVNLPGGKLAIIGVNYLDTPHDWQMIQSLSRNIPENEYRLLLYHTPDNIVMAKKSAIDLYLAGHTHGGQISLPIYGAIITGSYYGKRYEAGLYQEGTTTLYVSRGLGMEGGSAPRARFFAAPELVVIDLVPAP